MEQCPLVDVIGLCHACAISQVNGRERGQVVRLFAGRVIEFMNQALDPDDDANGKASARLARATPWEVATLLWSAGELGARHYTTDENRRLAHRKLRLVSDRPFLSEDELQSLSAASTLNLVRACKTLDTLMRNCIVLTYETFAASRYIIDGRWRKRPVLCDVGSTGNGDKGRFAPNWTRAR